MPPCRTAQKVLAVKRGEKPAYNIQIGQNFTAPTKLFRSALSDVICNVAASVAEVTANQPNQQGHIISFTYAAESRAAPRAPVVASCISEASPPPSLPPSIITCLRSLFASFKHRLLPLSNHRRCYYFYRANKVAWSQRTAGSGRREKRNARRDRTCGRATSVTPALARCRTVGLKVEPP